MDDFSPSDLKTILHSKRANVLLRRASLLCPKSLPVRADRVCWAARFRISVLAIACSG